MNILETTLSLIAPHRCVGCGQKGYVLCDVCIQERISVAPSRCYRCHKATRQYQTCPSCRSSVHLSHVWVVTHYEGLAKEALERLKFQRASAASIDIGRSIASLLPLLPPSTLITHAPTAHTRIRQRGFDQAELIARSVAKRQGLTYSALYDRLSSTRQLGSTREQRIAQAKTAFRVRQELSGRDILIIDDVTTSGATLESLARLAKDAGASSVMAAVFAQAID